MASNGDSEEEIGMEKWQPLNREQALAARDFSRAGETFFDHKGQWNEVLYSILTPLGYQAHVSAQRLQHIEKHPIASKHKNDVPYILNNPDLEKMEVRFCGEVIEFIFGSSKRIVFGDENQPGLEIGRDKKSQKVVAFMCLDFPYLYKRVLRSLKEKPIPGIFSVHSVDEGDKITPVCDPRVKNATLAEIVQWVREKYYAHLPQDNITMKAAA